MNPVFEAIYERRSIRDFQKKPVPRDIVEKIIEAGNQAPYTSMDRMQPWRFVVAEAPEFREKLREAVHPAWKKTMEGAKAVDPQIYENVMALYNNLPEPKDMVYYAAPLIIFAIAPPTNVVCAALASENMMLAAQSLGLGTCYVGFGAMVQGSPEIVKALELTDNERIYGPILLGYPKEDSESTVAKGFESFKPNKQAAKIKWI